MALFSFFWGPSLIATWDSGRNTLLHNICILMDDQLDEDDDDDSDDDDGDGYLRADNAACRIRQAIADYL